MGPPEEPVLGIDRVRALVVAAVCAAWAGMQSQQRIAAMSWCAAAGLLAGATALVRPIAVALGVPLAIAVLIGADRRWRIAAAALLLAVFSVLPVSWTIRNARETGVATLSSLAGINLLHFRAAATLAGPLAALRHHERRAEWRTVHWNR